MSSCIPPKQLPGQKEASMSEGEGDDDGVEQEQESFPSWRIYSDQCACGYSGCHCRSWMRWWDKTFQMLKYVEYVDLPVSTLGVSGIPTLGDELLDDPTMRYSRVSVGERLELVKREPLVRSLHKIKSPKSKKRPWSFKELKSKMNVNFPFCVQLPAKQGGNQANTLSAQSVPRHIFKVHWEDFVTHPKIPGDYINAICRNISQKSVPLCIPRSVAATHQWPTRNRALQLIAYIQYTYRLPSEIFFLAINLLDRYIAGYQQPAYLTGTQWDLVGLSCLWLAWKYENHTSLPPLDDLITHSQLALITRKDVIFAEWTVRRTIGLDLFYTSPLTLTRLELLTCPCTRETKYVARFLAEVSMTVRSLARCPPTVIGYYERFNFGGIVLCTNIQGNTQHYIQREKAVNHQAAMFILMGVLYMPRPIERPREQALFYKWTLPITATRGEGVKLLADELDPQAHRSKPFELGPGPYPEHPLFEA
ncbi:unnamed protein product [Rhizoctonia solani]|uniref:Cyclin N-terminal domain-containing protein n=1 Tax=Rhizoctonia solani TaxID=456999 RepID=A0A8H3G9K4_9AGAM|nr:unnamed protein product [Rhizoctonia solani]